MSNGPLAGVRVLEVASHVFVPMGGSVLSEWGADVIKVEHPVTGDPQRGLVTAGLHKMHDGVDPYFNCANRGKRSVGIDVKNPEGRRLLSKVIGTCDVFLTNLRLDTLRRLELDVDDVRADNSQIIYARGTAFGPRGPDADRGGFDSGVYWSRSGMQHVLTSPGAWPTRARPAFGDVVGGLTMAGAISTALYRRGATGEPSVVDASLYASALWQIQFDVMSSKLGDDSYTKPHDRSETWNPLVGQYRTRDQRFVSLMMLAPQEHWLELCKRLGRPEIADDPRFVDMEARKSNARACVETLDAIFSEHDLAEWKDRLRGFEGQWAVLQTPLEVHDDPQVIDNEFIVDVEMANGASVPMVTSPVQFDGRRNEPTRGPEHGEHTELVLLEVGLSWQEISEFKDSGAIL